MADAAARPFDVSLRAVFGIAVPMSLAHLSTPLIGLVDMAVIGQGGTAAVIGAVALGALLFNIIGGGLSFLRMSTTAWVAQAFGANNPHEIRLTLWRALALAVVFGVLVVIFIEPILWAFLTIMGASAAVADPLREYAVTRAWGTPLHLANYAILGWMLGLGQAKLALVLQTLLALTNIILSVAFVYGLGWGITGVAWASNAAEVVMLAGGVIVMARAGVLRPPPWRQMVERAAVIRVMSVNADLIMRSLILIAAFAFFNGASARGGDLVLAANAIILNIFSLSTYLLDGLATAAEALGGRALGARRREAFDKTVRLTLLVGTAVSLTITVLWLATGGPFVAFMTTAEDVRAMAITYLPWAALTALTGMIAFVMDGFYIGAAWTRTMRNMMIVSLIVFMAAWWVGRELFGNHGLWLALNLWLLARGVTLWVLLPRMASAAFAGRTVR
ncbi:MAG: MATE family efflux transporter [Pseudomonadota bacterium]